MWIFDFIIKGLLFWFILRIFYIEKLLASLMSTFKACILKSKNFENDSSTDNKNSIPFKINGEYIHDNKKFFDPNYNIEKVYAIKFNYIGRSEPEINKESGFIWLNTDNNTINIYHNDQFYEFPILRKSIIKQYIKRSTNRDNN